MQDSALPFVARWGLLSCFLLLPLVVGACAQTDPPTPDTGAATPEPSTSVTHRTNVNGIEGVVRSIAGIQVGTMNDADVVAMYGAGAVYGYQDQPADRRYYTDPSRSVTLMSGWHTDGVVSAVELTEGTALPPGVDPALTEAPLSVPVEIDKGVALGMTPQQVIGLLGKPTFDGTGADGVSRTLSYEVWADDPAEAGWISCNAVFSFEDGRLHSLAVYSGD